MKLHLGCGRTRLDGYINIDISPLPSVDVVADVGHLPFADSTVDEIKAFHLLEHLPNPLKIMEEWWRVSKDGAICQIRIPHGASDNAWEDPTHQRPYFPQSFGYFSMPFYHRSSPYGGYCGDWQPEVVRLLVAKADCVAAPATIQARLFRERNFVREMVVDLRCVKPARAPEKSLIVSPKIEIHPV